MALTVIFVIFWMLVQNRIALYKYNKHTVLSSIDLTLIVSGEVWWGSQFSRFVMFPNIHNAICLILLFSCSFVLVPSYGLKSDIPFEDHEGFMLKQEQNHDVSGTNVLELINSQNFEVTPLNQIYLFVQINGLFCFISQVFL